eukprot:810684-Rhodomonas_salina.1
MPSLRRVRYQPSLASYALATPCPALTSRARGSGVGAHLPRAAPLQPHPAPPPHRRSQGRPVRS